MLRLISFLAPIQSEGTAKLTGPNHNNARAGMLIFYSGPN